MQLADFDEQEARIITRVRISLAELEAERNSKVPEDIVPQVVQALQKEIDLSRAQNTVTEMVQRIMLRKFGLHYFGGHDA